MDTASAVAQKERVRALISLTLAIHLVAGVTWQATAANRPRQKSDAGPSTAARGSLRGPAGMCKPPAAGTKIKVNLKPDSEVSDLIAWYASLTCRPLLVGSGTPIAGKKVTLLTPTPMTLAEIDNLFLAALDAVGLTVERDGRFLYIIANTRARHSNTPIIPAR